MGDNLELTYDAMTMILFDFLFLTPNLYPNIIICAESAVHKLPY